jgi:hypothetical protein
MPSRECRQRIQRASGPADPASARSICDAGGATLDGSETGEPTLLSCKVPRVVERLAACILLTHGLHKLRIGLIGNYDPNSSIQVLLLRRRRPSIIKGGDAVPPFGLLSN